MTDCKSKISFGSGMSDITVEFTPSGKPKEGPFPKTVGQNSDQSK